MPDSAATLAASSGASASTISVASTPTANSRLTSISEISELHQLRELYRRDWPTHCVGNYCLSNFIDWLENRQQLSSVADMKNLQIFTWDNDWHSDGLCIIVASNVKICPAGYVVRPLNAATDAEIINPLWPNRHQGSLFVIKRLIEWNANIGVYTEGTDELVAWCLRLQAGFLGALQVKENCKRLGLGSLVTAAISRYIAEQGDDVMALVGCENRAPCGMFSKLGFKVIDNCRWLRTYPTKNVERTWPDGE